MMRLFSAVLISCLFFSAGCRTTKGYDGPTLSQDQVAVVYADKIKSFLKMETLFFCQVDEKVVGTYVRGWPSKVTIPSGRHRITVRYYNSEDRTAGAALGGAVGAAIAGLSAEKKNKGLYRELDLVANPGTEYIAKFESKSGKAEDLVVWIENKGTGDVVSGARP